MKNLLGSALRGGIAVLTVGAMFVGGSAVAMVEEPDEVASAIEEAPRSGEVRNDVGESLAYELGGVDSTLSVDNAISGEEGVTFQFEDGSELGVVAAPAMEVEVEAQGLLDDSARLLAIFEDPEQSTSATFTAQIPEGFEAVRRSDGGFDIVAGSILREASEEAGLQGEFILASIDAPWAVDADGRNVATSFELQGEELVQSIHLEGDEAFPVVADPRVVLRGYYASIYYNASETRSMRDQGVIIGALFAAMAMIAALPGGSLIAAAMGVIGLTAVGVIATTASNAVADRRCLRVDIPSLIPSIVRC